MTPSAAALLAAVAAWFLAVAPGPPAHAVRRARRLVTARAGVDEVAAAGEHAGPPSSRLRAAAAVLATVSAVALLGGTGAVAAPLVGGATWVALGRLEPAAARRRREQVVRALPPAVDLLVACAEAGAPPRAGLDAVGEAVGGPVGEALVGAADAARLGASFDEVARAWAADPALAPMAPVVTALARSEDDGAALTRALAQLAADLRAERTHRVAAAARRAGVRATVPLGLCFLPAFVLVGLVPVVVGLTAS